MRLASARLLKVPPEDRFSWYVAATESVGVVAAAASVTTDDRTRRELVKAWQAINRTTPAATSVGMDVAPGDAAQLRTTQRLTTVCPIEAAPMSRPTTLQVSSRRC